MYKFNAFLIQGKKFYEEKNYEKASACLKWAVRLQPENGECYIYKGLSEFSNNQLDSARLSFEACCNKSGYKEEKALAHVYAGFCCSSQQERLHWIVKATVADSNCHMAWLILAQHYNYLLKHSGMGWERTLQCLRTAITFSQNANLTAPDQAIPLYTLGTTYLLAAQNLIPFLKEHPALLDSIRQYFQGALTHFKQADALKLDKKEYTSDHYENGLRAYAKFLQSIKMDKLTQEYFKLHAKCAVTYSDIAKRSQGKPQQKTRSSEQVPAAQNGFFKNQNDSKPKKPQPQRAWNYINRNN